MKFVSPALFIVLLSLLSIEELFTQNVWKDNCTSQLDNRQRSELGALLDIDIKRQTEYTIYLMGESTRKRNVNNASNIPKYSFIPDFRINEVIDFSTSSKPYITVELAPIEIDKSEVKRVLMAKDPKVSINLINPAQVFALRLSYPTALSAATICETGGRFLDKNVVFILYFKDSQDAKIAVKNIKTYGRKSGISMDVQVYFKFTTVNFIEAKLKEILESDAYRDYVRPVVGMKISLLQKAYLKNILKQEFEALVQLETPDTKPFVKYFDDILEQVFNPNETIIPFKDAASMLSDFAGDPAYATDVLRKLDYDSHHLSNEQWKKAYNRDKLEDIVKNAAWGGGGGVQFKGFKIGGNAANKKEVKQVVHDILNTEDSGQSIFQEMFKYNWEGEKYTPKGITAYEVINVESVKQLTRNIQFEFFTNAFENVAIPIE